MKSLKKKPKFYRFYRTPLLSDYRTGELLKAIQAKVPAVTGIETEHLFCIESERIMSKADHMKVNWALALCHRPHDVSMDSFFKDGGTIIEIAPRLHFETSASRSCCRI